MYNTALNFYLVYFHLLDFNLKNFKEEIISLFKNDDPKYKYNFHLNTTYYMHLFLPNGDIINTLPFILFSINDKEDVLEDLYRNLLPTIDKHFSYLEYDDVTCYMGLYISSVKENKLSPKSLFLQREMYLENIKKMHGDLSFPLSLVKK